MATETTAPRLIAVGSGKGGVGKTWFSITLAHALARMGRRVLLVDADFGLANVDVQLGVIPPHDIGDAMAGRMPLHEAIVPHPLTGIGILAGRSGSGALAGTSEAEIAAAVAMLRRHGRDFDEIVLDLPAGADAGPRRLAAEADLFLAMAVEDPASLVDAYAVLKLHRGDRPEGQSRVVVNLAATYVSGEKTYGTIRRVCQTFLKYRPPLAGVVRRDDRVRESVRRQMPLLIRHPDSAAAADVTEIAAGLGKPVVRSGSALRMAG